MAKNPQFSRTIAARVPESVPHLVAKAAARQFVQPTVYIRQAVCEKLARDGFTVEIQVEPANRRRSA